MSVVKPHLRVSAAARGMTRIMDFEDPKTGQPELRFYYFIGLYGPADSPLIQRFITSIQKNNEKQPEDENFDIPVPETDSKLNGEAQEKEVD